MTSLTALVLRTASAVQTAPLALQTLLIGRRAADVITGVRRHLTGPVVVR